MRSSPASGSTVLQPASLNNAGGLSLKALLSRLLLLENQGTSWLQGPSTPRWGASFSATPRPSEGGSSSRLSRPGARSDLLLPWPAKRGSWGSSGQHPSSRVAPPPGPRGGQRLRGSGGRGALPGRASSGAERVDRGPRPVSRKSLPGRPGSHGPAPPPPEKLRPAHLRRGGSCPGSAHPGPEAARRRRRTPQ